MVAKIKYGMPNLTIKTDFNKNNSGNVFSQWQKGIKLASSEYIWIAELDDKNKPAFLGTVIQGFNDPQTVLSYCNSKYINDNGKLVIKDSLRKIKDLLRRRHATKDYNVSGMTELNRNLAVYNSIPNVSAVVFKNLPNLVNILDESKQYQLSGDWIFYIELAKKGKIAYSHETLNQHRIHSDSVSSSVNLKQRYHEMITIHNKLKNTPGIKNDTIQRMDKIEQTLKNNWSIEND